MRHVRYLMLDFDGVLHVVFPRKDRSHQENQFFAYLPALEQVLRQFPDVAVVITSSWRLNRSLAWIKSQFSPDIAPRIVGVTPKLPDTEEQGQRQREIETWLADRGEKDASWVAVDDMPTHFSPSAPLIVTDDGFREKEAAALKEMLELPT